MLLNRGWIFGGFQLAFSLKPIVKFTTGNIATRETNLMSAFPDVFQSRDRNQRMNHGLRFADFLFCFFHVEDWLIGRVVRACLKILGARLCRPRPAALLFQTGS